nr:hypothetical protein [Methylomarinum sp. Ch1-1]MDP4521757.1 hypothetical protein [Methylomarinum sp. Ch1-1]
MRTTCFSRRGRRSYAKQRLAFGCVEQREAHRNRCASYRQHTLLTSVRRIKRSGSANVGRLREASRHNPPGAKLAIVRIQADCLAANPPYGRMPM